MSSLLTRWFIHYISKLAQCSCKVKFSFILAKVSSSSHPNHKTKIGFLLKEASYHMSPPNGNVNWHLVKLCLSFSCEFNTKHQQMIFALVYQEKCASSIIQQPTWLWLSRRLKHYNSQVTSLLCTCGLLWLTSFIILTELLVCGRACLTVLLRSTIQKLQRKSSQSFMFYFQV